MIFNLTCGAEYEIDINIETYENITSNSPFQVPVTVFPTTVILQTSVNNSSELCVYYRSNPNDEFVMVESQDQCPASSSIYSELDQTIMVVCNGGTTSNPATLKCIVLGVKK